MRKLIIVPLLLLAGCDYAYRYDCQDPANFENAECKPPLCQYEGECSGQLVGLGRDTIEESEYQAPVQDLTVEEEDCNCNE